ncbi:MAG: hypothetical protein R3C15_19660 [Thermoleophilia bacterium]
MRTLKGTGSKVVNVTLTKDTPLVVGARHAGTSNFILELVSRNGSGSELLVNEIGRWAGQVAWAYASRGRYRLKIDADGAWTITFNQPAPNNRTSRLLPGRVAGKGSRVVPVRTLTDLQPIVSATHRAGSSNFIVELIGYGDTSGSELLFNEIGRFSGQTLINTMPEGHYLLSVIADGYRTIRFTR